ncbi:MAG TPA: guanitoxin biosynthesis heme-dependent pre-guanitoxin N-hydroxylase GntA [Herpetosiphonaceae bacterium]
MTGHSPLPPEKTNPFTDELSLQNRACFAYRSNELTCISTPGRAAPPLVQTVHNDFRAFITERTYPCVGARAAVLSNCYWLGVYDEMGSAGATAGLAHDLFNFVQHQPSFNSNFTTFVACFAQPAPGDELEFEALLWQQLQRLHDLDRQYHAWDTAASADPADPFFSYSFAEQAFFIVGLTDVNTRLARRFAWPTLIFNAHHQFERLRRQNHYQRLQQMIRQREIALQGDINPNLCDFGTASEARQYAGRAVEETWRCPLHVKDKEHNS